MQQVTDSSSIAMSPLTNFETGPGQDPTDQEAAMARAMAAKEQTGRE